MEKLIDKGLIKLIEKTRDTIKSVMPTIREEIQSIITNRETDQHRIETTLDMLLDYLYWGFAQKEFNELNSYYSTIDKEGAADYQRFYDEIMAEDEVGDDD
jgi:hypothetical protein